MNNFELQKQFDQNIDDYMAQKQIDEKTKVIYLSYRRILIVSPRDFVYIRYNFSHGQEHWSVATSIPDSENESGKVRGEIILTVSKVVPTEDGIQVTVYSQVDTKIASLKPELAKNRGITEIKKYLDRTYQHIKSEK